MFSEHSIQSISPQRKRIKMKFFTFSLVLITMILAIFCSPIDVNIQDYRTHEKFLNFPIREEIQPENFENQQSIWELLGFKSEL